MGRRFKGYYSRTSAKVDAQSDIAESLSTLADPASFPFDKVANSYCYLAYRCIDGQYRDVDSLLSHFTRVFEMVDAQPHDHVRARWLVAVVTAHVNLLGFLRGIDAIDVNVLDRALDIHLLMPPDGWQRSLVNSLSCHTIRALIAKKNNHIDTLHEVLFSALEVYRRTIPAYQFIDDSSDILYEVHDAAVILGVLLEVGRGTNFPVRYIQPAFFSLNPLLRGPLRTIIVSEMCILAN